MKILRNWRSAAGNETFNGEDIMELFGGKILEDHSNNLEKALKHSNQLFDFANSRTTKALESWEDHFKRMGVAYVIIDRGKGAHDANYRHILLKRKWCYRPDKSSYVKTCNCNPLDKSEFCTVCQPSLAWGQSSRAKIARQRMVA